MSSDDLLGLRAPPPRAESPTGADSGRGRGRTGRGRGGSAPPPFRRRGGSAGSSGPTLRETARRRPLLVGLSQGGTAEIFPERSRRREATVIGASLTAHLLVLLALLGRLIPLPDRPPQPAAEEEPEPLLYAFEAPPEAPAAEVVPLAPPPPEPPPEPAPETTAEAEPAAPPPASALVIPKAQIAAPSTGFQNDLPFSEGDLDEFFTDAPAGDDPEAPADRDDEPDFALLTPEEAAEDEIAPDPFVPDPPAPEESSAAAEDPAAGEPDLAALLARDRLRFDRDAFRERIRDPAAEVRRQAAALAREKARVMAREEERERGKPTDIWRFLEGKRFRNPEGGLVSNRNNTLYYDDRGANLVPWITRLIAEVRRNWYIPYAASYQAGHVAIAISVLRSGALSWLQVVIPSGVPGFDNAAEGALRGAQLLPLPDDYPGEDFEIMLVFWYNERPYDLFGSPP